jgi:predicted RecB family nuclease
MRARSQPKSLGDFSFNTRDLMRAKCHHCTRLATARELGVPGLAELLAEFTVEPSGLPIRYGIKFEEQLERELQVNLGALLAAPRDQTPDATLELMANQVPVIYQAVLRGGSGEAVFSGRPDFLVREDFALVFGETGLTAIPVTGGDSLGAGAGPAGASGSLGYLAWDAKLSTSAKPEHLMQLGLYVDALAEVGFLGEGSHGLVLGSRELSGFAAAEVLAAMQLARAEFFADLLATLGETLPGPEALGPLICDASSFCNSCEYPDLCDSERRRTEHLALVAGINRNQIEALNQVGVTRVSELAEFSDSLDAVSDFVVERLSNQARVQLPALRDEPPAFEVFDRAALAELPEPSDGDLFFDLEGFSFFEEAGGLEYLFGWVGHGDLSAAAPQPERPAFGYLWANNRDAERQIFEEFVDFATQRLREHPDAHIYHYANYEIAALKRLAERHQSRSLDVERLIAAGVFVDLYRVVKNSLIIGQESYSIKKLETYYTFARASEVTEAMGSIEYYDQYREHLLAGTPEALTEAERLKRQVLDYNRDDCVSTLALYRWLGQLRSS